MGRYIKSLKMEVLATLAAPCNVYDIVGELSEYARDISPSQARAAVRAIGRIALNVSDWLSEGVSEWVSE